MRRYRYNKRICGAEQIRNAVAAGGVTILASLFAIVSGFGAVLCWLNLSADVLLPAIVLSGICILALIAAVTGSAECFFLILTGSSIWE